jgi:hypothetical protein
MRRIVFLWVGTIAASIIISAQVRRGLELVTWWHSNGLATTL